MNSLNAMPIVGIIVASIVWYVVGVKGYISYRPKKFGKLTTPDYIIAGLSGLVGPASWGFGWYAARPTTGWFDAILIAISFVFGIIFMDLASNGGPKYCLVIVGAMAMLIFTIMFGSTGKDLPSNKGEEKPSADTY
ncbi:MAG: hypothetical protein NT077_02340 [Candidatus Taylorbacteria bacterium]|nr:hypothetical protein [Candidatus Taylorbacteria bacterium]